MRLQSGAIISRIPHISLTPEQKKYWERWIADLESDKYTQVTHCLRDKSGFCCLGVACNVVDPKGWSWEEGAHSFRFRPSDAQSGAESAKDHLTPVVRKFFGSELGPLGFYVGGRFPDGKGNTVELASYALSGLNDEVGASFKEIASILRLAMAGGYTYSTALVK